MDKEKAVKTLVEFGRPRILREFNRDSCIVSTAVGIDVFQRRGIKARPLCVKLMVFNAIAANEMTRLNRMLTEDEVKELKGAWVVGVGYGEPQPGKIGGHLVAVTDDNEMLDLSLDQVQRPQYNMELTPAWFQVDNPNEFFGNKQAFVVYHDNCLLIYNLNESNAYEKSPDWTDVNRRRQIVNDILQRIVLT
jgi:hypothetical protein